MLSMHDSAFGEAVVRFQPELAGILPNDGAELFFAHVAQEQGDDKLHLADERGNVPFASPLLVETLFEMRSVSGLGRLAIFAIVALHFLLSLRHTIAACVTILAEKDAYVSGRNLESAKQTFHVVTNAVSRKIGLGIHIVRNQQR